MTGPWKGRYPLVLVHGAGYENDAPVFYWGRIPEHLRSLGIPVFLARTEPWSEIEENARSLAGQIREICRDWEVEKVNLIGHSRGGLESRAVAHLVPGQVASVTTVCSPHLGCDYIEKLRGTLRFRLYHYVVGAYWKVFHKKNVDVQRGMLEMTPGAMTVFNEKYPDVPGVVYQSLGATMDSYRGDIFRRIFYRWIARVREESDGLVTPTSAKWTGYLGTFRNCSHQYMADTFMKDNGGVKVPELYGELMDNLAEKGC